MGLAWLTQQGRSTIHLPMVALKNQLIIVSYEFRVRP